MFCIKALAPFYLENCLISAICVKILKHSFKILDLITIKNNFIHTKIYDKIDDFDFSIVNYPHLDGDVPHATSYGVYISQLIRFARACSKRKGF
jgi:hypothetical protein